jgi:hypothetical protein
MIPGATPMIVFMMVNSFQRRLPLVCSLVPITFSLDYAVCLHQEMRGNFQSERVGRFEVNYQLKLHI